MARQFFEAALPSGVPGLDEILHGGFAVGKTFVIKGGPGSGKTTLALQFLLEGIRNEEQCLYVGVGGAGDSICAVANSHGWFLDKRYLTLHEIRISDELLAGPKKRVFHPSEVDLADTFTRMIQAIEKIRPKRVVIDTLAELRLLTEDDLEYRRQFLALRKLLVTGEPTVLVTDYVGETSSDLHLDALAHGGIILDSLAHHLGPDRRRLRVQKYRARRFESGWHDFTIATGGMEVFPNIVASDHDREPARGIFPSGNDQLDALLGGGLNKGSSTAVIGPSGAGKSSLSTQFVIAGAERGSKGAIFVFDETETSFLERSEGLGFQLQPWIDKGLLSLRQMDVAAMSPGEFMQMLKKEVEHNNLSVIVIDSLNGYILSMPDESYLVIQLHELFSYLTKKGVTTFFTVAQHGLIGSQMERTPDVSYLADNVIMLRFFELQGQVRRALSIMKKRRGSHEATIREMRLGEHGITLTEPLSDMQGVLTGVPNLVVTEH